jgi:hypothetical protein
MAKDAGKQDDVRKLPKEYRGTVLTRAGVIKGDRPPPRPVKDGRHGR